MHAYFRASEELLNTYVDWDLRLTYYIINIATSNGNEMPMAFSKVNTGTRYFLPQNANNVFGRCLRLSEAYLNYAEAKAMLGGEGIEDATKTLNTLREHRFDPEDFEEETFASQEELINFVRDERRRELCFEGHRWFDLRRWGMPSFTHKWQVDAETTHIYTIEEGDLLYTVPIPDEALQMNGSLQQNELPGKRVPTIE